MTAPVEVEFRATGVDGVQRQLRLVRTEIEATGKAAEGISHSALIGFSELARGVGKVAQAGEVGAFAMREFTGAAFRLGEFLGPAGPLIPIIGMIGFALYEIFHKAGDEMDKMKEKWHETLDDMVNAGDNARLMKQARDLIMGTPANYFQDGINALSTRLASEQAKLDALNTQRGGNPFAPKSLVNAINEQQRIVDQDKKSLEDLQIKLGQIREAILAVNNTPIDIRMADAMHSSALSDSYRAPQQALSGGRFAGGLNTGMFGLSPLLTGEKDHGGNYINPFKIKAADLPRDIFAEAQGEIIKQWNASMRSMQNTMVGGIAGTLSDALSDAFTGSWKNIGKDAKAGLGGIISDMGGILVQFGTTLLPLAKLFSTNPLTAAIEAISIGVLLEGLGKALGKAANGGGGSYGSVGGSVSASASSIAGQGSVTLVIPKGGSFLNPNDPDLMAQWVDMLRKAFGNRAVTIQELS